MTRGDNFVCSLSLIATIKKDKQNKLIDDEKTKWNKNNLFIEKQIYIKCFFRLHKQSATNIFSLSHSKTGQCRDKICHKLHNALKCIYMYAHKNCLLCLF